MRSLRGHQYRNLIAGWSCIRLQAREYLLRSEEPRSVQASIASFAERCPRRFRFPIRRLQCARTIPLTRSRGVQGSPGRCVVRRQQKLLEIALVAGFCQTLISSFSILYSNVYQPQIGRALHHSLKRANLYLNLNQKRASDTTSALVPLLNILPPRLSDRLYLDCFSTSVHLFNVSSMVSPPCIPGTFIDIESPITVH